MSILNIRDLSRDDVTDILNRAIELKQSNRTPLLGKSVGMIFEKPSNRTRLSFEVGIHKLGGHPVCIRQDDIQIGHREPVSHVSRVMSRYFDMIVYRTTCHDRLSTFAQYATIPVINGLSNVSHPCQAMADALTILDHFGSFNDVYLTYIGDGNNVGASLAEIAVRCGFQMAVVCPPEHAPAHVPDGVIVTHAIDDVIATTNVVYTDVWTSMGDEDQADQRIPLFQPYQINHHVMQRASNRAIFLHCLPAVMGQEVTEDVFESTQSKVFDQSENRMHAQNGMMDWLMKGVN